MNLRLLESYLGREVALPEYPLFRPQGLVATRPPGVEAGDQLVCLHAGGGSRYKRWPAERWQALAATLLEKSHAKLVFLAGPGEAEETRPLLEGLDPARAQMLETSWDGLIETLLASELLICLDSGPMNLAAVLGRRVLALFGPGDSRVWAPQSAGSEFLHAHPERDCDPDFEARAARTGENPTADITLEQVTERALAMLGAPKPPAG